MTGRRLLHYEILEKLGEGGMGVVYKARDLTLHRLVALKVLSPDRVAGEERRRRFLREAQSASALNHPNIVTVYEFASEGEHDFLAMEYVDGKTLERLIPANGLAVSEALNYAVQIADGLSRAHAAGILHRDLKPSNVIVNKDGQAKILDFGLAKMTDHTPFVTADETSTASLGTTLDGAVAGTVSYMSPEQAEGKKMDQRSDIFSFGALLYEMLSGRRAFDADSRLATMAAVIREEPKPLCDAGQAVPRELDRLVARCLRKDPARRFQTAADLKVALTELKDESDSGTLPKPAGLPVAGRAGYPWWFWAAALFVVAALAGAWRFWPADDGRPANWRVKQITQEEGYVAQAAISPDGRLVAYSAMSAEGAGLHLQQFEGSSPVKLYSGTVTALDFSPDSAQLAFRSSAGEPAIHVMPAIGGATRRVLDTPGVLWGAVHYSPDGKWIATTTEMVGYGMRFLLVPAGSGEVRAVQPGLFSGDTWFVWAPDSTGFLVRAADSLNAWFSGNWDWWFVPLEGKPSRVSTAAAFEPTRLPNPIAWLDNRLYCDTGGNLARLTLSPRRLSISGRAAALTAGWAQRRLLALSDDAHRLVFADASGSRRELAAFANVPGAKTLGAPEQLTRGARAGYPSLSRARDKLLYVARVRDLVLIRVRDLRTGKESDAVEERADVFVPLLSPDGNQIAYRVREERQERIKVAPTRGGAPRVVCSDCGRHSDWTPDSKRLIAHDAGGQAGKVGFIDVVTGKTEILLESTQRIYGAHLAPNHRWVVFSILPNGKAPRRNMIAPYRESGPVPESEWREVFPLRRAERWMQWSPRGDRLYFFEGGGESGFSIGAVAFDPVAGKAIGEPFQAYKWEDPRYRLQGEPSAAGLAVGEDRIYCGMIELQSNLWTATADDR